jgi:hypothetical protein
LGGTRWEGEVNAEERGVDMTARSVTFSVVMVLIGVIGLVTKRQWSGSAGEIIWAYQGNITASFSVFFIVGLVPRFRNMGGLAIAVIALAVVELFELTNGFGVMTNVYDPMDLVANVAGVGIALAADIAWARVRIKRSSGRSPRL